MSTEVVVSRPDTKFRPGVSGNPKGRPLGSKNQITLFKIQVEGELRAQLKPRMADILDKAIDMALAGDGPMIKMLVDKWVSASRAGEDEAPPKEKIQINIGRLDTPEGVTISGRKISPQPNEVITENT